MQPAISAPVIDCRHILAAHRRVEQMRTRKPDSLEPMTMIDLKEALGERMRSCQLLGHD